MTIVRAEESPSNERYEWNDSNVGCAVSENSEAEISLALPRYGRCRLSSVPMYRVCELSTCDV